jgi:hypothetical protein
MEGHGLYCHIETKQFADVSIPGVSGQLSDVIMLQATFKIEICISQNNAFVEISYL